MSHYSKFYEGVRETYDEMFTNKYDNVNRPRHYNSDPSGVEPIQITQHMSFCLGNVVKYVMRHKLKGGVEDLKKAQWYLTKEIERLAIKELAPSNDDIEYQVLSNRVEDLDTSSVITSWEEYTKQSKGE